MIAEDTQIGRELSLLDRYLTVWIFIAMALGVWLGSLAPEGVAAFNQALTVGQHTNLLMYPAPGQGQI